MRNYTPRLNKLRIFRFRAFKLCLPENSITPLLQELLIRYCEDCEVRGATLCNICFAYQKIGEHEKALEQAKKLPNLYKARENALVYFLQGEEKRSVARSAPEPLAWTVSHQLTALYETENNTEYLKKAVQIVDILFGGENEKDFDRTRFYPRASQ